MAFLDQYGLSQNAQFQERVQAAIVHAALAVSSETLNDVQTITTTGNVTGGTFTLTYSGQTTAAIAWNASAGVVQTALSALSNIGTGNIICTGGPFPSTGIVITFTGTLGNTAQVAITGTSSLTGTAGPGISIAHTTVGVGFVNHSARSALASKILNNPTQYAQLFAVGVTDNATVMADFNTSVAGYPLANGVSEATAGNDIQFQVNSIFNAYT